MTLQTPAEQVIAALQGWPQCWKCLEYQKPHNSRLKSMRLHNMEMCCCTPCRLHKLSCGQCGAKHATYAMRWLLTSRHSSFGIMEWKPFCIQCCRSKKSWAGTHWNDLRESTDFRRYPDGPSVSVPAPRRSRHNRRRAS